MNVSIRNSVARAAYSAFMSAAKSSDQRGDATGFAAKAFPGDRITQEILLRGATGPLTTGDATQISETVGAFIGGLAPLSAAARLMARGLPISLTSRASVAIPYRTGRAALTWVGEGEAIPVKSYALSASRVGPLKKIAGVTVHSREFSRSTSAAPIFERLLREDAADALDVAVFGSTAASDIAPAGLLDGVTPLPATVGGGLAAMEGDLIALSAAVTTAGAQTVVIVTTPELAATIKIRKPELADMVWPALGLPAGRVVAIDPDAFAFASGLVDIEASKSAVLHMDDEAPTQLSIAGSPNAVAAPARSMFQTDLIATRLIFDVSFAMRAPGLVAFIDGAAW
ncbi:phage major capsid family protein [Paracoccus rhizosphaerae]|uniref:Phage major capsid protein n=1 Tax=Paracoccus rhizosphaerae TaxID=1133347 RepID=A0ABV6CNP8_9RHOB|nr:phage major capsid protein [Paracoccus rhizosphaerae]